MPIHPSIPVVLLDPRTASRKGLFGMFDSWIGISTFTGPQPLTSFEEQPCEPLTVLSIGTTSNAEKTSNVEVGRLERW